LRSLTVSVRPEDVEAVLDGLLPVAPRGVHELPGPTAVELLLYGEDDELAVAEELCAHEPLVQRLVAADAPGDWRDRRSQTHRPERIGERLLVRPSWMNASAESPGRVEIVLDETDAFGTGSHPTTHGCLEALERLAPGASLADLGCGSGVVAVAAALLGWARVLAVDVSPPSIEATRANASLNGVEIETLVRDLTREPSPDAETLVANVPLSIHSEIASRLPSVLPGSIIASGVPADDLGALLDVYAGRSFKPAAQRVLDGWAIVTFGKGD
jgi:ribosomal protein L11 methyltransferase